MTDNTEKTYELRELKAEDIFPMFKIVSKIGVKEFKGCFESDDVKKMAKAAVSGGANSDDLNAIGLTIAVDLAGLLTANLPNCKDDIFGFLASLSGMTKDAIADLPMATFIEMIIDVIKKQEFKDFFQAVAKLFK